MKLKGFVPLCMLLLACLVIPLAYSQTKRAPMERPSDVVGVKHTSGVNGKWVYGCSQASCDSGIGCNMGVGNLGPKCTYHWVAD